MYLAPYGTQSTTSMQGYSGQPIFYPNPVPQVLVQQAYPNLPVSSVSYIKCKNSLFMIFNTFFGNPKWMLANYLFSLFLTPPTHHMTNKFALIRSNFVLLALILE